MMNDHHTVRVVLFDCDGVVITGKRFSYYLHQDFHLTEEETAPFFTEHLLDCIVGKADLKKELQPYLVQWKWQGSVDEFCDYWFRSENAIDSRVIDVVAQLRSQGVRCFVATNQEQHRTTYLREMLQFNQLFDGVFSSSDIGYTKGSPEFFARVLQQLQPCTKEELLLWDDTQQNVDVAREFGIHAEFYSNFNQFQQKMKEYSFN
ncbi:MAG: HAD-IA family hydrolase [Candidatus Kerfeldbacteria bacterium]|nr:HAD-IA family hydrolase [Candidatus Kerfeldbacteria bacterium]